MLMNPVLKKASKQSVPIQRIPVKLLLYLLDVCKPLMGHGSKLIFINTTTYILMYVMKITNVNMDNKASNAYLELARHVLMNS